MPHFGNFRTFRFIFILLQVIFSETLGRLNNLSRTFLLYLPTSNQLYIYWSCTTFPGLYQEEWWRKGIINHGPYSKESLSLTFRERLSDKQACSSRGHLRTKQRRDQEGVSRDFEEWGLSWVGQPSSLSGHLLVAVTCSWLYVYSRWMSLEMKSSLIKALSGTYTTLCEAMDVLINGIVVIVSQCICLLNCRIVHL